MTSGSVQVRNGALWLLFHVFGNESAARSATNTSPQRLDATGVEGVISALDSRTNGFSALRKEIVQKILNVLAEMSPEGFLEVLRIQYFQLPSGNILAKNHNWESAKARLELPGNARVLAKVRDELQRHGHLFSILGDGSLQFMDDNSAAPPMFLKDKERYAQNGDLEIIYERNPGEMRFACAQVARGTHEWATIPEMLEWAQENGFQVFEPENNATSMCGEGHFSPLMRLAKAASPTHEFVGALEGPWVATALADDRYAAFDPVRAEVYVSLPARHRRDENIGLLRRLTI